MVSVKNIQYFFSTTFPVRKISEEFKFVCLRGNITLLSFCHLLLAIVQHLLFCLVMVHCNQRGSEIISGDHGHTFKFEQGKHFSVTFFN